jgi:hypothetical protein
MRFLVIVGAFLISFISKSYAGPDQILLPADYENSFVLYATVDKRDREPNVVRVMYIDPDAAAASRPGTPLPEGTRLVMAEHIVKKDGNGETAFDRNGRMIPTEAVSTIFVAEKRAGIDAEYDEALRIGDWEFAVFLGDGSRETDVNFSKCRECHRQAVRTDYTFSVFPNLEAVKR